MRYATWITIAHTQTGKPFTLNLQTHPIHVDVAVPQGIMYLHEGVYQKGNETIEREPGEWGQWIAWLTAPVHQCTSSLEPLFLQGLGKRA